MDVQEPDQLFTRRYRHSLIKTRSRIHENFLMNNVTFDPFASHAVFTWLLDVQQHQQHQPYWWFPLFLEGGGGRGMGRRGVGRCCRMRVTALLSVPASLMEDGWADSLALVVIDWCTAPCRCPAGSGGVWNHCVSLANHPLTSCCPAGQANDSHVYTGTCLLSSLSSSPASLWADCQKRMQFIIIFLFSLVRSVA